MFGLINRQGGGFDAWCMSGLAGRIIDGFNKGCTGGLADRCIGGNPQNWSLWLHGALEWSVIIDMGCGNAWWCLHPRNLLHVAGSGQGCGFLNYFWMCL